METIHPKDRETLRSLVKKQLEYAHSAENDTILNNCCFPILQTK